MSTMEISPLIYMRLFQTGKSNRISDTRRTRHDIHAYLDSSRCSSHPFYCMLAPRLIALAQVNDVMKFKPLYSLIHIPSSRNPYHYRALRPSHAGHLYLTMKRLTLFSSQCRYRPPVDTFSPLHPFCLPSVFLSPFFPFVLSYASPIE